MQIHFFKRVSSLAQEESRSISQNVTWGHRKSFQDGHVHLAYSNFLGYDKGENGKLKVVESEAETIKAIYRWFLEGKTTVEIADLLNKMGIKTPMKCDAWKRATVNSILKNEKYKGDAILQKTYTKDFLTHKIVKNNGEVDKYYITDCHEAIISKDDWEQVQFEFQKRGKYAKYSSKSEFLSKIVCSECGSVYGPKVWHSKDKYRKTIYRCLHKYEKRESKCPSPILSADEIKSKFIAAYNEFMVDRTKVIEDCVMVREIVSNTSEIEKEINRLTDEYDIVIGMVNKLVKDNASKALNQDEYLERYENYERRFNELSSKIDELKKKKSSKLSRAQEIDRFIKDLETRENYLESWDKNVWGRFVEKAIVNKDGTITFRFINDKEITK